MRLGISFARKARDDDDDDDECDVENDDGPRRLICRRSANECAVDRRRDRTRTRMGRARRGGGGGGGGTRSVMVLMG